MCVIILNQGTKIDFARFVAMYSQNKDGIGIMYRDLNQEVRYEKDLLKTVDDLHCFYKLVYEPIFEDISNDSIVVHFRYATDGDVNLANCHPFKFIASGVEHYLMHNGIMPSKYRNYSISDKYTTSDTKNFVNDYLNNTNIEFSSDEIEDLKSEIGNGKLAILSNDNLHVINSEGFKRLEDGNFYSNLNWSYRGHYYSFNKQYQLL